MQKECLKTEYALLLAYTLLSILFLLNYNVYLNKPTNADWNNVVRELGKREYSGQPIVFNPAWLKNYASDHSRLKNHNTIPCDDCESLIHITLTDETKTGYALTDQFNVNNMKIRYYSKNPSDTQDLIYKSPKISIISDDSVKECSIQQGQLSRDCWEQDWQNIRLTSVTSGGVTKTCLFAHPRNKQKIIIGYEDIPLTGRLSIQTALSDGMTGGMKPVKMEVQINDETAKTIIHPDQSGWQENTIQTPKGKASLKFIITSEDDKRRHYCFNARTQK
jgi:hypothetical protein